MKKQDILYIQDMCNNIKDTIGDGEEYKPFSVEDEILAKVSLIEEQLETLPTNK